MPLGPMSLMVVLLFLALNSNRSSPFIFCVCACIFVLLKPATLVEAISTFPKGSLSITADISILPKRLRNKRERRAITAIIRKFKVADVEQGSSTGAEICLMGCNANRGGHRGISFYQSRSFLCSRGRRENLWVRIRKRI